MSKTLHPNEILITPQNEKTLNDLAYEANNGFLATVASPEGIKRYEALQEQKRRQEALR